jgi:hypothetical protein
LKAKLLLLVRAFIALLNTAAGNVTQVAALKAQVADLTSQLTLTDDESAEVDAAVNQIGAATPPTAADVAPVAAVAPAATVDPAAIAAATAAVPADVTAAAAALPTPTP